MNAAALDAEVDLAHRHEAFELFGELGGLQNEFAAAHGMFGAVKVVKLRWIAAANIGGAVYSVRLRLPVPFMSSQPSCFACA